MIYQPLEEGEIRLLELPPRSASACQPQLMAVDSGSIISCRLFHARLDESVTFEALSYVWGADAGSRKAITLNHESFTVTPNLHDALRHLQLASAPRTLWVDAICINQADFRERGEQVQLMRRIYQTATSVSVFLGEAWDGLDLAFAFFEAAAAQPESHFDPSLKPCLAVRGHTSNSRELRWSLHRLLTNPWWGRLWTVQEYALARRIHFQCGDTTLDGEIAYKAYVHLRRHENTCCWDCPVVARNAEFGIPLLHAFLRMDATVVARETSGGHRAAGEINGPVTFEMSLDKDFQGLPCNSSWFGPGEFLTGLDNFRPQQCTDPRDKIYGLTGLYYSDRLAEAFSKPDYSLPVERLYTDLVHASVQISGNLNVLSRARAYCETSYRLPSFVPDWSLGLSVYMDRHTRFTACDASGGRRADWTVLDPATVRTKAILLDRVTTFGKPMEDSSDVGETLREWASLARIGSGEHGAGNDPTAALLDRSSSFWHTLCGDILIYHAFGYRTISRIHLQEASNKAEDHVYASFRAWYDHMTKTPRGVSTPSIADFQFAVDSMTTLKKFATTRDAHYGFVSQNAREGDFLALLPGGCEPFLLRLVAEGTYEVVGIAYVHGMMRGEAFDDSKLESVLLV